MLKTEPLVDKWRAFGWHAVRVEGAGERRGSPAVVICDTRIGCGVPLLETREKAHFMRVSEHEWQIARDQLAEGRQTEGNSR